ncbi:unnamed protein product [Urochloa decumbens]|uniref:Uncharacterized protein n=1 Tax=Urochloa decumbens TaxID=240449 RepID=A0ABC9B3Y5_9POAL
MAAKFPSASCKILVVVVAAVMIGLLFSPAGAGEAVTTAMPKQENPQCNPLVGPPYVWPDCDTWCWNEGHPGGYVKSDVCCCNSGTAGY